VCFPLHYLNRQARALLLLNQAPSVNATRD
jgi:hypothetical protein